MNKYSVQISQVVTTKETLTIEANSETEAIRIAEGRLMDHKFGDPDNTDLGVDGAFLMKDEQEER